MMLVHTTAGAQGLGDWFNQKKEQRKQLLEQIAALKVYMDRSRKGYDIVKDGTKLTGDIRRLDKNMQGSYFDSWKTVSPSVRKYDRIGDIIRLHEAMLAQRKKAMDKAGQSDDFTSAERNEMNRLYAAIASQADKDLDELLLVATDGKVSMSDDERIVRIEKLYAAMQKRYAVQQKLSRNILALAEARERKRQYLRTLRGLQ